MTESTVGQEGCVPQPLEIKLDEFRLVERTCKPILVTGFVTTLLLCTAMSVALRPYSSIVDCLLAGIGSAFCSSIGLGIALFLGWGLTAFLGNRLNLILGKPLNPSAVAAVSAGIGFAMAHAVAVVGFVFDTNFDNAMIATVAVVAVFGSLLFQTVARVQVKRDIARHNLRAARKLYKEEPCHVRFQIRQLMILMGVISLFLAVAMRIADGNFVLLVALWGILTAAAFYPAIIASQWVDQKLGSVTLKLWEDPRPLDWDVESKLQEPTAALSIVPLATLVQCENDIDSNDSGNEPPAIAQLDQFPGYRHTARFTSFDAMSSALKSIGFAGGAFGLLFVIFLETSKAVFHHEESFAGLFLAIPTILGGLIFAAALAGFFLLIFGTINFVTGERFRLGTIAALAGGLTGSIGAWCLLCACELVHFVPSSGAVDFSADSNRFTLAMILLASVMGQTFGRLGVKSCGFRSGLTHEEYLSESTGSVLSRFTLPILILSACAWALVATNSQGFRAKTMEDLFTTMIVGAFACTLLVWPVANFLARSVGVAGKESATPKFPAGTFLHRSQA